MKMTIGKHLSKISKVREFKYGEMKLKQIERCIIYKLEMEYNLMISYAMYFGKLACTKTCLP
jgi:hypothetical protein